MNAKSIAAVALGDIASIVRGVTYKKDQARKDPASGYVPLLRATNIGRDLDFNDPIFVPSEVVKPEQLLRADDIVVAASSGSLAIVGKAARLKQSWQGTFGAFCYAVRPHADRVRSRFLELFMQTSEYRNHVSRVAAGTNINNLARRDIEELSVPIPSLAQQDEVLVEIEKHLTRLDAAEDDLTRARRNLGRYRASVLHAATTDAMIDDGPWPMVRLEEVAEIQGGILKNPKRRPKQNHFPFLRVANVLEQRLDLTEIHRVELFEGELEKWRLEPGDLLVVEGNGSPRQIGRMAVWKGEIPDCVHQNHLVRARARDVLPGWVAICWNSPMGRENIRRVASSTSGLYTLSAGKVAQLPIPNPPLGAQEKIVAKVERAMSVLDVLHSQVVTDSARQQNVRQSILGMAFSGRLVPDAEVSA